MPRRRKKYSRNNRNDLPPSYSQINIGYVRLEEPTSIHHDNRNDVIPIRPITRQEGVIISPGEPIKIITNEPVTLQCPYCNSVIQTEVETKVGKSAWLSCALVAMTGLLLGCCLLPFCMDETRDAVHKCPNCQQVIRKYEPVW